VAVMCRQDPNGQQDVPAAAHASASSTEAGPATERSPSLSPADLDVPHAAEEGEMGGAEEHRIGGPDAEAAAAAPNPPEALPAASSTPANPKAKASGAGRDHTLGCNSQLTITYFVAKSASGVFRLVMKVEFKRAHSHELFDVGVRSHNAHMPVVAAAAFVREVRGVGGLCWCVLVPTVITASLCLHMAVWFTDEAPAIQWCWCWS